MEFEVEHILPGRPDWTWSQIFSDDYRNVVAERTQIHRECIAEEVKDGRRVRTVRVTTTREIPAPIRKVFGSDKLHYEMTEDYDDAARVMLWSVRPSRGADRIRAEGRYALFDGPDENQCRRVVSGRVDVSVPLVGGQIEKFIGAELEAGYQKSIDFLRDWLNERLDRASGV